MTKPSDETTEEKKDEAASKEKSDFIKKKEAERAAAKETKSEGGAGKDWVDEWAGRGIFSDKPGSFL